jgi:toxin-antitoxin system PIN domain toxin
LILPDVNLLLYAHSAADVAEHPKARAWWETTLNAGGPVVVPWAVALGYVRVITHPRGVIRPLSPANALADVAGWLARPNVRIIEPGPRHLAILSELLSHIGVAGRLTSDAHLAAIAIEYQCELHSHDADFGRFPGLRWHDPLRE